MVAYRVFSSSRCHCFLFSVIRASRKRSVRGVCPFFSHVVTLPTNQSVGMITGMYLVPWYVRTYRVLHWQERKAESEFSVMPRTVDRRKEWRYFKIIIFFRILRSYPVCRSYHIDRYVKESKDPQFIPELRHRPFEPFIMNSQFKTAKQRRHPRRRVPATFFR
jgi:hypothetical protein